VQQKIVDRRMLEGEPRHHRMRTGAKGRVAFRIPIGREVLSAGEFVLEAHLSGLDCSRQEVLHHAPTVVLHLALA
jgi:hypothetical protein